MRAQQPATPPTAFILAAAGFLFFTMGTKTDLATADDRTMTIADPGGPTSIPLDVRAVPVQDPGPQWCQGCWDRYHAGYGVWVHLGEPFNGADERVGIVGVYHETAFLTDPGNSVFFPGKCSVHNFEGPCCDPNLS
ncbi:MAG: hypothetical protein F4059_08775 [Gemmatimonadetes bacterium]|nr:hypothetical protein [Gemmatimonadota bacterium]